MTTARSPTSRVRKPGVAASALPASAASAAERALRRQQRVDVAAVLRAAGEAEPGAGPDPLDGAQQAVRARDQLVALDLRQHQEQGAGGAPGDRVHQAKLAGQRVDHLVLLAGAFLERDRHHRERPLVGQRALELLGGPLAQIAEVEEGRAGRRPRAGMVDEGDRADRQGVPRHQRARRGADPLAVDQRAVLAAEVADTGEPLGQRDGGVAARHRAVEQLERRVLAAPDQDGPLGRQLEHPGRLLLEDQEVVAIELDRRGRRLARLDQPRWIPDGVLRSGRRGRLHRARSRILPARRRRSNETAPSALD
jgi:hypothetical protein